jgi:hypothetical protein
MPQSIADLFQSIPMSPNLSQSLGRAHEIAREQAHRALLLEHLLLALTEDPDAAAVLRACNVDVVRLGTDVSGYLGGLLEDMRTAPGTEPAADAELLRVLEAARQAAQQSRRRGIDGAIVLAAIVGDGKSPAAGLLKTHGLTFEEAIRTLQKASAQARSKQFAPSAARTPSPEPPAPPEPEKEPPPPPQAPVRAAAPSASTQPSPLGQSPDEILAAARARIQQRGGIAGKAEPAKPSAQPKPEPARKDEPEELPLMSLSSFTANRAPPQPEPPPQLDGWQGQPDLGPPPGARAGSGPLPPPTAPPMPAPEPALPPPRAFARPGEGAPPPPLPPRGDGPPLRADLHDGPNAGPSRRPPLANGAAGAPRRPAAEPGPRSARGGQRAPAGPLMEAIPRRMRVGAATQAQVRISRDKVDSLLQLIGGGGRAQFHPEAVAARVLSVRLKAPDGGFAIEAATPETQWIETAAGAQADDHVSWRWTVTPQRRGRQRLQLVVAARTVGRDGIAAESAPPDRTIEVTVRPNRLRRLVRWVMFLVVFGLGAGLGVLSQDKLAQDLVDFTTSLAKNILGLLATSGFLGSG